MVKIWRESGGPHFIEMKGRSQSHFDDDCFLKLSNGLNKDMILRNNFLKPYHQTCAEYGRDIRPSLQSVLGKIASVKSKIGDNSIYQSILDGIKNIPNEIFKNLSPISSKIYIKGADKGLQLEAMKIDRNDTLPINKFFSEVVSNSVMLKDLISSLDKYKIIKQTDENFVLCKKCSRVSSTPKEVCLKCGAKGSVYPMLTIPNNILSLWEDGGNKFLEVMTYHVIKEKVPNKVYSNLDLSKIGRKDAVTELDVFVSKSTNSGCVILSTVSPKQGREKRQGAIISSLRGMEYIVVTTQSNIGKLENNALNTFPNVLNDSNFPDNLIAFLKKDGWI